MRLDLYTIPLEAERLETALAESAGEITPELEEAMKTFEIRSRESVEHAACIAKRFAYGISALKEEEERLRQRRKGLEAANTQLREIMLPAVQLLGGKVKLDKFTLYTQTRENPKFDLIEGHSITELPYQFLRFKDPERDLEALKAAHKAGEPIPEILKVTIEETVSLVIK
jgi:hypothetical protein